MLRRETATSPHWQASEDKPESVNREKDIVDEEEEVGI